MQGGSKSRRPTLDTVVKLSAELLTMRSRRKGRGSSRSVKGNETQKTPTAPKARRRSPFYGGDVLRVPESSQQWLKGWTRKTGQFRPGGSFALNSLQRLLTHSPDTQKFHRLFQYSLIIERVDPKLILITWGYIRLVRGPSRQHVRQMPNFDKCIQPSAAIAES
jgi:hypothetical protein